MLNQSEQMAIKVCVCFTFRKMGGRNPYMLQSFKARLDKKKEMDIQDNRTQHYKSTEAEKQNKNNSSIHTHNGNTLYSELYPIPVVVLLMT